MIKNGIKNKNMEPIQKHIRILEMYKTFQLLNFSGWQGKEEPFHPPHDLPPIYRTAAQLKEDFPGDTAAILDLFQTAGIISIGKPELHRNGVEYLLVRVLAPIQANISRLPQKPLPKDLTSLWMGESLRNTTLPADTPETPEYWYFFNTNRERVNYFLRRDAFGKRWHTPVTSMKKELRKRLLLYGQPVVQVDLDQCQPRLLAALIQKELGTNPFSRFLHAGGDLYETMAEKAGLSGREAGKALFFKIAFGQPDERLEKMFGNEPWVRWVNTLKERPLRRRDRPAPKRMSSGHISHHNNLAFLLQRAETSLFHAYVWGPLAYRGIPFLTVHDAILVRMEDLDIAVEIMQRLPLEGVKVSITYPDTPHPL